MNEEKLTILIKNYDDMNEDGKKELLGIGESYLECKDTQKEKIDCNETKKDGK